MNEDRHVAIVTGAGGGIGRAIALRLAESGYAVAVADIDPDGANRVAQELSSNAGLAKAIVCDIGDRAGAFQMVAAATEALGPVRLLVNNAGIVGLGPLAEFSEQNWRRLFRVNVDGVFFCCQAVLPGMLARRQGSIVNIASWNGKLGAPNFGAYSATKAAVISITQTLAREVAAMGVRVNAVCPGIIAGTPMREQVQSEGKAYGLPPASERAKTIPLGRLGKPEEIADAVAFLASEQAAYMTGQAINVTGGLWLH
ncbi:MAG: SDR family oxidoreductase [Desulfobacterales bacterium]|nr:MAG: SDR family oxidoreductase [Desulfobacterales bacterium]